jgi:hypothetical protein
MLLIEHGVAVELCIYNLQGKIAYGGNFMPAKKKAKKKKKH